MNSDNPLVSVLMTAFNRQDYIAEAIESVLASSFKDFELIIVDDRSSDNTVAIARKYEQQDDRIRVYLNEKNLGDYPNRNKAAEFAKGKYIKYLDSDDDIYPWGLEAMVYCMERFPEAGFGLMSQNMRTKTVLPIILNPKESYQKFYFRGYLINMGPSGSIIKKDAFVSVGGFSGRQFVGDTELWYKLGSKWSLVCLPTDLIWWREHDNQQIKEEKKNSLIKILRYTINLGALLNKECPLTNTERKMAIGNTQNLYCRNIILLFCKGNFRKAIQLKKSADISLLNILISLKRNKYPRLY